MNTKIILIPSNKVQIDCAFDNTMNLVYDYDTDSYTITNADKPTFQRKASSELCEVIMAHQGNKSEIRILNQFTVWNEWTKQRGQELAKRCEKIMRDHYENLFQCDCAQVKFIEAYPDANGDKCPIVFIGAELDYEEFEDGVCGEIDKEVRKAFPDCICEAEDSGRWTIFLWD